MIEYLDDIHIYLIDGVIVPSVSELCTFATNKSFEGVPKSILNAKAEYGTTLHDAIQHYEETGEIKEFESLYLTTGLQEHIRLREGYSEASCEMIVSYKDLYAGRLDILAGKDLIDVKTTYKVDVDWLQWQLGYYRMALNDMGYYPRKFFCEWLPKGRGGQLIQIITKTDAELLENYQRWADAQRETRTIN